jgi:DNA-binding CsgD family transcriptional regulator
MVADLKKQGLSDTETAKALGMTTTEFRNSKSIAKAEEKQAQISQAQALKATGMSNLAIGREMGIPDTTVGNLLKPGEEDKASILHATAAMLEEQVAKKQFVDIGTGVEYYVPGMSKEKLATAVALLQAKGYMVHKIQVDQLGTSNKTTIKVLSPPGTTYPDVAKNKDKIRQIQDFTEDGGRSWSTIDPPLHVDLKRVGVRYAEEGGSAADGVIYVRPGKSDLSLGGKRYAQVRIAVGGSHYLKGMAVYKDDLPPGVDLIFNTNKSDKGSKLDAMKPLKKIKTTEDGGKTWKDTDQVDLENPFGAVVRQIKKTHPDGREEVISAMNIVNEEGKWEEWSRNLSSQFLSKQSPKLAKEQLDKAYQDKRKAYEEINSLTNPAVKKKLLEGFSDSADASSIHLKAAALPNQANHVILPINSLKPTEIYAPGYANGTRVALVRHPHGGIFEIPELVVNNRNKEGIALLGNARDAVGIHSKVAERLSGADFDGDTVLVIPNNAGRVKSAPALAGLKNFDTKSAYPGYPGMKVMSESRTGFEMGDISNLITDMTIKGANDVELARAVRHSMVVIDAAKHGLNYRLSAEKNGIRQLKAKYQDSAQGGASTLISRAKSRADVEKRKERSAAEGGPIDKRTGERIFTNTGDSYIKTTVNKRTGETKEEVVFKTERSTKLAEAKDAHTLSSGTPIEAIYADHSNKMKALANEARKSMVSTKDSPYSPSAKTAYSREVASLDAKLKLALRNAPLERQAQVVANAMVAQQRQANPEMESSELKKIKGLALAQARIRTGAEKQRIKIEPSEWEAIQAGAISTNQLNKILNNADLDKIKELATPRAKTVLPTAKKATAQAMLNKGLTYADVAASLGVSVSTLKSALSEEG